MHLPNLDPTSVNAGYKIVFDNLDKTVKPRYMRSDAQAQSLHYVQGFAMKDRIDYSCFSEKLDNGEVNLYSVLPNSEDDQLLKQNFAIHICRIIADYLSIFKEDFKNLYSTTYSTQEKQGDVNEIQNSKMQLEIIFLPITGELLDETKNYTILIPLVKRKQF